MTAKQKRMLKKYTERLSFAKEINAVWIKTGEKRLKILSEAAFIDAAMFKRLSED